MKKIKHLVPSAGVVIIFFLMALACATPQHTRQYKAKPEPCTIHAPITYSPLLVKINLSGSYTMKDLSGAQRDRPTYILDAMNGFNAYKYKIADGVTPNLTLNINLTTDSYEHYGATVNGYVYDGSFYTSFNTDYVTMEKLYDDIARQVNIFISQGWCKNCTGPCITH